MGLFVYKVIVPELKFTFLFWVKNRWKYFISRFRKSSPRPVYSGMPYSVMLTEEEIKKVIAVTRGELPIPAEWRVIVWDGLYKKLTASDMALNGAFGFIRQNIDFRGIRAYKATLQGVLDYHYSDGLYYFLAPNADLEDFFYQSKRGKNYPTCIEISIAGLRKM